MSKRIEESLDIVRAILDHSPKSVNEVRKIRNLVKHEIAEKYNCTYRTIQDKFTRQFNLTTDQFDQLVFNTSKGKSEMLAEVFFEHSVDEEDRMLISAYFSSQERVNEDNALAQEFNFDVGSKEFKEGKLRLLTHRVRERNTQLIATAKKHWSQLHNGNIKCSVCDFSFFEKYGIIGRDFIEAHHIIPLSKLDSDIKTKVSDLLPVCSNCHRMIHRVNPMVSITQFKRQFLNL